MNNDLLDRSIQALDPARGLQIDLDGVRARGAMTRALAGGRRTPTRALRRFAVAGCVTAALVGANAVLPELSGVPAAYAQWTPRGTTLTGAAALEAEHLCFLPGSAQDAELGIPAREPDGMVAERRGPWTFVAVSWTTGERGSCLRRDSTSTGADDGIAWFGVDPRTIGGHARAVPATGSVEADVLVPLDRPEGTLYQLTGDVGADVVGVVIHAGALGDVRATVDGGRFAAWWPEGRITPVGHFDPDVTIHRRDGSTVTQPLSELTHVQL